MRGLLAPDYSIIIRTIMAILQNMGKTFVNSMLRLGEEQKSLNYQYLDQDRVLPQIGGNLS